MSGGTTVTPVSSPWPAPVGSTRTAAGATYILQYTDILSPVNWQNLTATNTATATGVITLVDTTAPASGRYSGRDTSARHNRNVSALTA